MSTEKIDRFLFSAIHPKPLIIFRILVAVMIAFMFAPRDLNPIYPLTEFPSLISVVFSDVYHVIIYILIILFALGAKSRIAALILFILLVPHDFLNEGRKSKQVILCVLMCFVFLKSLPIWQFNKKNFDTTILSPMWPMRLIQIQLSLIYGINAIAKSTPYYLSGDALIDMSTAYKNFHVDFSSGFYDLGFVEVPIVVLAISSVLIEYFLAIGFWFKKTRWIALIVGVGFHIYLTTIMSIFMLDYVSIFLYLAFIIPFQFKPKNTLS
ncbi:HTTM domain-containing protein [Winogradskyella ursingii]|uniref:HTTM domain-containing protein n=1 Tax=Winogradskyella ursingii TaxID=2686079 RepID=UPI0015C74D4F|nr:HTTM domain-containing protein [Winogradskyella ursingii]